MYLSRLKLGNSISNRALISNPNKMHGIVQSCFNGEKREVSESLWRIDFISGEKYLLILSKNKPDLQNAFLQLCDKNTVIEESKDYDKFLEKLQPNGKYRFRVCANPVFRNRNKKDEKGNGILTSIAGINERTENDFKPEENTTKTSEKSIETWLKNRAEKLGFEIISSEINNLQWFKVIKQGQKPFSFKSVDYEGVLKITDIETFIETLKNGIGREKSYGCGLMTVIPS